MLEMQHTHRITNIAMDKILAIISLCILPNKNNAPHSYKQLIGLIGTISHDRYERHVCLNKCHVFGY